MSDVTVGAGSAPTTPAAPAAQPATVSPQGEAVVNTTPTPGQTPIGSQAPPKPEGQESRQGSNLSRREAIAAAFEKSKQAQTEAAERPPSGDKPRQQAAKPEAKPQQFREQGRFARDPSRQQPADQQADQQNQPGADAGQRGEQRQDGRQVQGQGQQSVVQNYEPLPEGAPFRQPPQRFSEQAKADWNGAPESVRGAVHQLARQFQGAYEKYRGDHEVMNELRPFHEMATKQGTTLARALNNYYSIEQKIRGDVFGGFDTLVRNLRLTHDDGSPVTFRDVAYTYLNMTPEQQQITQQQNVQTASQQQIGQLYETVNKLAQNFSQLQYEKQFDSNLNKVDKFAEERPRFAELAGLIKQEIDLGFTLEQAYNRACLLRPTQAAQTRTQSAQTRRTSISGAPDGGKPSNTRPSDGRSQANGEAKQHPTRREALAKAMRRASNGM